MVKTIVLNSNNVVAGSNNSLYRYSLPNGQVKFEDGDKIAVQSLNVPYSWFNINASLYNNISFQYIWHTSGSPVSYTITLPNPSFLTVQGINAYLQSQFIANGHYLVNGAGQYVYYAEIVLNTSRYAYQINTYPLPSTLPSGWSNPAGLTLGITTNPQIVILTNNFGKLIGFSAGTYSPTLISTNYSALSDIAPVATPVISVLLQCNILNNTYSIPNRVLFGFTPNTTFGNNIDIAPSEYAYNDILAGYYNYVDIQFTDQNGQNIQLQDPNVVLQLVIKSKDE